MRGKESEKRGSVNADERGRKEEEAMEQVMKGVLKTGFLLTHSGCC